MSSFKIECGHIVDGHCIVAITKKKGLDAFKIWRKHYGKKIASYIIEKGGGFKYSYIWTKGNEEDYMEICTSCFSKWKDYLI